jgi:hypothetical protein
LDLKKNIIKPNKNIFKIDFTHFINLHKILILK